MKYFVDEAVIVNTLPNYLISQKIDETIYIDKLKNELIECSENFNDALVHLQIKIKFQKN